MRSQGPFGDPRRRISRQRGISPDAHGTDFFREGRIETIYGRYPIFETLRARRRKVHRVLVVKGAQRKGSLDQLLQLAVELGVQVEAVERDHLDQLHEHHQGVVAEVGSYPIVSPEDLLEVAARRGEPALILLLDVIQNPQNFGTLLRTAEAVGVHGVVLPKRRGVGVTAAVVRASAGATEHLRIAQGNLARTIANYKGKGLWIAGLENSAEAQPLSSVDLTGPLGLVIGGEGEGMRRLVRESCDFLLKLPMRGSISSLNAAVAGSIALYTIWQAREYGGFAPDE
jgi:23S rRNA (guanosine2251-2'-O)-methyltransferase